MKSHLFAAGIIVGVWIGPIGVAVSQSISLPPLPHPPIPPLPKPPTGLPGSSGSSGSSGLPGLPGLPGWPKIAIGSAADPNASAITKTIQEKLLQVPAPPNLKLTSDWSKTLQPANIEVQLAKAGLEMKAYCAKWKRSVALSSDSGRSTPDGGSGPADKTVAVQDPKWIKGDYHSRLGIDDVKTRVFFNVMKPSDIAWVKLGGCAAHQNE